MAPGSYNLTFEGETSGTSAHIATLIPKSDKKTRKSRKGLWLSMAVNVEEERQKGVLRLVASD